jgi:hypothetical protein
VKHTNESSAASGNPQLPRKIRLATGKLPNSAATPQVARAHCRTGDLSLIPQAGFAQYDIHPILYLTLSPTFV